MSNKNALHIAFEDLFKLIIGLISDDLKLHKHFHHLNRGGLDTTPLNLDLSQKVFVLVGFKETDISEELEYWYFKQAQRVNTIDFMHDEKAFTDLSSEILEGLLKMRNELYVKKGRRG
jgi:hypothetical protein